MKPQRKGYSMRSVWIALLAAIMLLLSTGLCFAADPAAGAQRHALKPVKKPQEISRRFPAEKRLLYARANSVAVGLSISRGKAQGSAVLNAKSRGAITSAEATLKLVHKETGKSQTCSGKMKKKGTKFVFSKSYKLPKRGNYYVKARIKCYKNGKCAETIDKTSRTRKY